MKKLVLAVLFLAGILFAAGCAEENDEELTVYVATDLHYLAPELYDDGEVFQRLLKSNDGKLIERGTEILDAFVKEVKENHPDIVLLTGDLTFNGEMVSLRELKTVLEGLQKEGITVLVLPGNHDIRYPYACSYLGDQLVHVENISEKQFRAEMEEFGLRQAVSVDPASFSYVYAASSEFWIIALDANTEDAPGALKEETLAWLEARLKEAKKKGIRVITCSHQNVLPQSPGMSYGFAMHNHDETSSLLEEYGVTLNLSGHVHFQHEAVQGSLKDIATESISVWPLRYGVLHVNGPDLVYEKKDLGIYEEEAYARICEVLAGSFDDLFAAMDLDEETERQMREFAERAIAAQYAGNSEMLAEIKDEEMMAAWKKEAGDSGIYRYLLEAFR